jgi:AAA+ superfamily predicted ATPase
MNKRLYVLEEIDTLGDIVLDRKYQRYSPDTVNGELKLNDILTKLDGNNENPDRIIIITSNYPEKLDRAILRGGRIDSLILFSCPSSDEIKDYIEFFYSTSIDRSVEIIENKNLNYGDLTQLCFINELNEELYKVINDNINEKNKSNYDTNNTIEECNKIETNVSKKSNFTPTENMLLCSNQSNMKEEEFLSRSNKNKFFDNYK